MNMDDLSPLIDDLASSIQQKVGFKSMPAITLQDDEDNADVLLGKTAYYDPSNRVITVYVTNRHPKDILRSIAHEFIHHGQNLRGEFDNMGSIGEGYAQNDEHLRNMEKEAYLQGNMCFRDWEDGYKRQMMESIHRQNSFKRRNRTMKIHKWKNNELNKLLMEKFNLGEQKEEGFHACAVHVKENATGRKGKVIKHTLSETTGKANFYNVDFGGQIVNNIPAANLTVLEEKMHSNRGHDYKEDEEEEVNEDIGKKSVEMGADDNPEETKMDHLPDEVLKNIAKKKGKKGKQNESYRMQVRKMMEEILKLK